MVFLFLAGFAIPLAFAQNLGDGIDKIWLPACNTGTSVECNQHFLFHNAISAPFTQSSSVAVGTIIQKENRGDDSILYSINVDFYLKNYQPFDLLTATLSNPPELQTFPDVVYYNSPVFNEGDLVFVYLTKKDGHYEVLPESFALDKHEVRGPPPTTLLIKSPFEDTFEQGEKIMMSGEVRKMELVKAAKDGTELDVKISLMKSDDRKNIVFSDLIDIEPDGNYNYILDTSSMSPDRYDLEINYGSSTTGDRIRIEPNWNLWTPLKQIKSDVQFDEIQCREGLIVIQKHDGSPACVKPETKEKLVERGWTGLTLTTKPSMQHYNHLPEVKAFYETYEDVQFSIRDDHVSYSSGSDDGYLVRMNLFFDETHTITDVDFHCYFQRVHQYELPQENIEQKIVKYDCKQHGETETESIPSMEEPRFLEMTAREWANLPRDQVSAYYEDYKDDFYTDLGLFLIKDAMKQELGKQGIQNIHDDFTVYPGLTATSLPPHISFSAVVNATDKNSYVLGGSTFSNTMEGEISLKKLVFYPEILDESLSGGSRELPYERLLNMEPKIKITKKDRIQVESYDLILDLDKSNAVTIQNDMSVPIRIELYDEDKLDEPSTKSSTINPNGTGTVLFEDIGKYRWNVLEFLQDDSGLWKDNLVGEVTVVSHETENLSLKEKLEIARAFIHYSREDIPLYSIGSGNGEYLSIGIKHSVKKMIPDAKEYYEKRIQEWIPFEIPIKID